MKYLDQLIAGFTYQSKPVDIDNAPHNQQSKLDSFLRYFFIFRNIHYFPRHPS
ncbi:MAG: hypothetical protein ACJAWQ_000561 [Paraglaciecola sp.]|jgi:hypothetical protein